MKWEELSALGKNEWMRLHFQRVRMLELMNKDMLLLKAITELMSRFMDDITEDQLDMLTEKTLTLQSNFKSKKQALREKK
jgi:mannitol/fructose-specific phosphotransferase system IIA component (Ntr-type)